ITERKRAEEALQESQRSLATLLSNLPGMAYRGGADWDRTMEFVSAGSFALTGYHPAELIQNRKVCFGELIHPDDRPAVWHRLKAALREKQPYRLSYRLRTARGEEKWIWEQGRGITSPEGELLALEGVISTITRRKRAEEAARESRERFEELVHFIDGIVWEADAKTCQFSFVSQQAERLLGYPVERWTREPTFWQDHLHPEDRAWVIDYCARATAE